MARVFPSLQRLVAYLVITLVLTIITLVIFHEFVAGPISLSKLLEQAVNVIIILGFGLTATAIIRHFKPLVAQRMGDQAATILQYVMFAIAAIFMTFGILNILQVSATDLLAGAGIISITAGRVISTFVGSILSGFLVFTNYQFKVGDNIVVNNVPGKVVEMTALVMRIHTNIGQVTIPNSAIASGGVIITVVRDYETYESRFHYKAGDRVVTSYMNEEGTVKEITPYHTIIQLDSGKEVTFLTNNIMSGAVVIAKITLASSETEKKAA